MLTKDFYTQVLPGRIADPGQPYTHQCPPPPPPSGTGGGGGTVGGDGNSGGGSNCTVVTECASYYPCNGPHESGAQCCAAYVQRTVCH